MLATSHTHTPHEAIPHKFRTSDQRKSPRGSDNSHLLKMIEDLKRQNSELMERVEALEKEKEADQRNNTTRMIQCSKKFKDQSHLQHLRNERLKEENDRLSRNEVTHNRIYEKIERSLNNEMILYQATSPNAVPLLQKQINEYEVMRNQLIPNPHKK